jgi:ubiquitin-protein ligase E3 D
MRDGTAGGSDPSDLGDSNIHLYAEHLQNIRTLSIQASLATASNKETKAKIFADDNLLTLSHEGQTASIRLPVSIDEHGDATLTLPAAPSRDLTFRLNIEKGPGDDSTLGIGGVERGNEVPWMAIDLTSETEVRCARCRTIIVHRGAVKQWKDLPSEGWAEMMEFWHCHKPEDGHSHDSGNAGRGFAANSKLAIASDIGLVGPTDFLLHPSDCAAKVSLNFISSSPSLPSPPSTTTRSA